MDQKDKIILQQLDVIRTMTENRLSRMGDDFWGAPQAPKAPEQAEKNTAASTGNDETNAPEAETPPPENIEDLQAELDSYIGLTEIKKEVKSRTNVCISCFQTGSSPATGINQETTL